MNYLKKRLQWIQSKLAFEGWEDYPQFSTDKTLGRTAFIGTIIGVILGIHVTMLMVLAFFVDKMPWNTRLMLTQWVVYIIFLCLFHMAEFFVTAIWTPSALTASSFLVNHSLAYTTAFIISLLEFSIRSLFFRNSSISIIAFTGFIFVLGGLCTRSLAMKTCGANFNHFIQHQNNSNHRLVTYGIYHYFRHPSYLGYFYWAVGTQLLLCNPISFICYVFAAWKFFSLRIPYEERTLLRQYNQAYADYMERTWIGIPFISSKAPERFQKKGN